VRDVEAQANALGYAVVSLDALDTALEGGAGVAAVVASQGHYDEQALETILRRGVGYVGLVASRTRGSTIKQWLTGRDAPGVEAIRNPAGLDLGARTAPEVALSILAEIVQSRPTHALDDPVDVADAAPPSTAASPPATAIDPVCRMEVDMATAKHTAEVDGTIYYFCCPHCRSAFVKDPAAFLSPAHD